MHSSIRVSNRSVLPSCVKAHELDNLYVVDGSFFPSSGAVNPALTIMANALRVGDSLMKRLGVSAQNTNGTVSNFASQMFPGNRTMNSLIPFDRVRSGRWNPSGLAALGLLLVLAERMLLLLNRDLEPLFR